MYFVQSKIIKRMDHFKVRGRSADAQRKILLPLSLGASSLTLLHVLDQQLRVQMERTSRTGYELDVLIVDQSTAGELPIESLTVDLIHERYSLNAYFTVPLEDVFNYDFSLEDGWTHQLNSDTATEPKSNAELLKSFLSLLPSATSRTDMINILRTRLIVEFAKSIGCECIAWGDSTTRLAEKTLAETAKGRGHSVPWQTADGPSPQGVFFTFPMRDLLRKEITAYSTMTSPPLTSFIVGQLDSSKSSISSKDSTIDGIMSQYFESVEENYPSIVANVVRTSTKLQADKTTKTRSLCSFCALPVRADVQGLHGWGGDQADSLKVPELNISESERNTKLCYGCARSSLG